MSGDVKVTYATMGVGDCPHGSKQCFIMLNRDFVVEEEEDGEEESSSWFDLFESDGDEEMISYREHRPLRINFD